MKNLGLVCLGVLLTTLVYHLGVETGAAQAAFSAGAPNIEQTGSHDVYTAVQNRTVYAGAGYPHDVRPLPSVPATSEIVASGVTHGGYTVMLDNGDVYTWSGGLDTSYGDWLLTGNIFGAATSTEASSWGRVKERYR